MREDWLHRDFIQRLEMPAEGDTPLMLAIRRGDSGAVSVLLKSSETNLSQRNSRGETALYLALQACEFDMVAELYRAGAPDAEDMLADERFLADEHSPLNRGGIATAEAELERHFTATARQDNLHSISFETLQCLRDGGALILEKYYPRSQWLRPLTRAECARNSLALFSLQRGGIAKLGTVLSSDDIQSIRQYLAAQPIYAGHTPNSTDGRPRSLEEIERAGGQGCYSAASALATPRLLEIANDPGILNIVAGYMGFTPTITAVNLQWSFPHERPDGQLWTTESMHRDYNDYWELSLFIYLNEVREGVGPHRYYMYTHTLDTAVERLQRRVPADIAPLVGRDLFRSVWDGHGRMGMVEDLFSDDLVDITGPAGTAFLTDTFGFHRAMPPRKAPRLFAWFRYGMALQLPSAGPFHRPEKLISEKYDPYINRLLPGIRDTEMAVRPADVRLLVNGYSDTQYNICEFDGSIYAIHRTEGGFDIEKIRNGDTSLPVFIGSSADDVIAQLACHVGQTRAGLNFIRDDEGLVIEDRASAVDLRRV